MKERSIAHRNRMGSIISASGWDFHEFQRCCLCCPADMQLHLCGPHIRPLPLSCKMCAQGGCRVSHLSGAQLLVLIAAVRRIGARSPADRADLQVFDIALRLEHGQCIHV